MGAGALPDRRRHALARPRRAHLHAVGRLAGAADGGRAGAGRRQPARLGLAAIMLGFVVIISLFAHIERKRTRAADRPRPRRARPLQEPRRCASRRRLRRGDDAHHARQHERRRAALRRRRPLGLPEQGDGAPARHAGRGAEGAADLQGHHPPSRAARRLRPARDAARRPGGLDRQPHRALQPAGPAGRAAAHHHRPHRRGDLPAFARRPRAHRASRPHRHRRAGEPPHARRNPSRSARAPPCARCSTTWATAPRSMRRTADSCSTTPPSAACSISMRRPSPRPSISPTSPASSSRAATSARSPTSMPSWPGAWPSSRTATSRRSCAPAATDSRSRSPRTGSTTAACW